MLTLPAALLHIWRFTRHYNDCGQNQVMLTVIHWVSESVLIYGPRLTLTSVCIDDGWTAVDIIFNLFHLCVPCLMSPNPTPASFLASANVAVSGHCTYMCVSVCYRWSTSTTHWLLSMKISWETSCRRKCQCQSTGSPPMKLKTCRGWIICTLSTTLTRKAKENTAEVLVVMSFRELKVHAPLQA